MSPEQVTKRLAAYGAEGLDDLNAESADVILAKLQAAVSKKTDPA